MLAVERGMVACSSRSGRVRLHLMKLDLSATVCGRYPLDAILAEDLQLPERTRECGACNLALARKGSSAILQVVDGPSSWITTRRNDG